MTTRNGRTADCRRESNKGQLPSVIPLQKLPMIRFTQGNIFDSGCQALVNPVNCVGVMGKGLALQFKCGQAEGFDPSGSGRINYLRRRSASKPRAEQQSG